MLKLVSVFPSIAAEQFPDIRAPDAYRELISHAFVSAKFSANLFQTNDKT